MTFVDDANCEWCNRRLWDFAVWLFHDGGPLCERCLPDELYDDVVQMYELGDCCCATVCAVGTCST